MISINYAELDDVCLALKKFQDSLSYHLEGSRGALLNIYFTLLEMLECPQIGMLDADMAKVQRQGTETLDEIQQLIAGIHRAINEFHDAEHKTAHDITKTMEGSLTLLGGVAGIQPSKGASVANKSSNTSSEDNNILDTVLKYGENLGDHPVDTGMAVLGVGLGVLGEFGSGAVAFVTGGFATPVAVPVALFSTNSIITSGADLIDIASGHHENQGNLNPLKQGAEVLGTGAGMIGDEALHLGGYNNTNLAEVGKKVGGGAFEVINFGMGVKGVTSGIGVIADKSYSLKEITNLGDKILPPFTVRVNNVSKIKKVGKVISIANTNANWAKKINTELK